ncbi:MAG: hypothetical protein ACOYJ2_06160 [Rickettsiales bacterium]
MKKLLLAVPVLIILILAAAMFITPSVTPTTVEVDVPLSSLQK